MKNQLFIYSAVFIALIISSCQNNNIVPDPINNSTSQEKYSNLEVTVKDGRIVFKSPDDLKNTLMLLKAMTEPERIAWDEKIMFTSLKEFYSQHKEGEIDLSQVNPVFESTLGNKPYIPGASFTRLLNADGVVQISSDIYRFVEDGKRLSTTEKNYSLLFDKVPSAQVKVGNYKIEFRGNSSNNEVQSNTSKEKVNSARSASQTVYLPLVYTFFDGDHKTLAFATVNSPWPWLTDFGFAVYQQYYQTHWFSSSWKPDTAQNLTIKNGVVQTYDGDGNPVTFLSGSPISCTNCTELVIDMGRVNAWDSDATVQFQGDFFATWNGVEKQLQR